MRSAVLREDNGRGLSRRDAVSFSGLNLPFGRYRYAGKRDSAALFAALHDGFVESVAETGGHFVDLVGAIDLNGFAGGVEGDLAMLAATKVVLQIGAHITGHGVVDQVIEQCQELSARHFSTRFPLGTFFRLK